MKIIKFGIGYMSFSIKKGRNIMERIEELEFDENGEIIDDKFPCSIDCSEIENGLCRYDGNFCIYYDL